MSNVWLTPKLLHKSGIFWKLYISSVNYNYIYHKYESLIGFLKCSQQFSWVQPFGQKQCLRLMKKKHLSSKLNLTQKPVPYMAFHIFLRVEDISSKGIIKLCFQNKCFVSNFVETFSIVKCFS
jgi:hypothetical protein